MKATAVLATIFLGVLLVSTFFALSAYILKVEFCALGMMHASRLCDIVNQLNDHYLFGAAVAAIAFGLSFLFAWSAAAPSLNLLLVFQTHAPFSNVRSRAPAFVRWLSIHYNSPNLVLAP